MKNFKIELHNDFAIHGSKKCYYIGQKIRYTLGVKKLGGVKVGVFADLKNRDLSKENKKCIPYTLYSKNNTRIQ